jgi:phosphoribosylformylglycinamidine synthase
LALKDYCEAFGIPLLSGKDSMYIDGNILGKFGERHKISGLETLQFTVTSVVDDIRKCITMEAKTPGALVYILGVTRDELGGSEYYDRFGYTGVNVPKVDYNEVIPLYQALCHTISDGLVASVHGIYRGGLGVHMAQVSFGGGLGLEVDLNKVPIENINRNDKLLFSESAGRFIVTVPPEHQVEFEEIIRNSNSTFACVGRVIPEKILIIYGLNISGGDPKKIIDIPIKKLKQAWKGTFGGLV